MKFIILILGFSLTTTNLANFKKFKETGVLRRTPPTKKQTEKFLAKNSWQEDVKDIYYILRDYKTFYITIVKNKNNLYEPSVNGTSLDKYPKIINLPRCYETLKDAQDNAIKFADKLISK